MQTALVIGLGISGRAACKLLLKLGYRVIAVDDNITQCPEIEELGVKIVSSLDADFKELDLAVVSPGISQQHPFYKWAIQCAIPVIGEAQFALQNLSQTMIGITGTNGKTTVTSLLGHIFCCSGRKAKCLGNIGDPLSQYALSPDPTEILVVELSSYQLETMEGTILDAALILNITPDHLDRYANMYEYAVAKWQIQYCLKKDAPLIVYDRALKEYEELCKVERVIPYSFERSLADNLLSGYTNSGVHDGENAIAAWLVVKEFGITQEQFLSALKSFKKPSHRVEHVSTIDGVNYFDDSKGTNLDAVIRAVEAMNGPIWLIAGGVDKGASYAYWKEPFAGKVKKIFAIGQAKEKIAREIGSYCIVEEVETLEQAVRKAAEQATYGSNVLLSPGCSSFDMFRDYAHRGREFQRIVRSLEEERRKGTNE